MCGGDNFSSSAPKSRLILLDLVQCVEEILRPELRIFFQEKRTELFTFTEQYEYVSVYPIVVCEHILRNIMKFIYNIIYNTRV